MTLSLNSSRMLALGLSIAAIGLVYALLVLPLTALYAAREAQIASLSMRAERLPGEAIPNQQATGTPYWPGNTDAVAAAGLQERVKALLVGQGAIIQSMEVISPITSGDMHKVLLKVRFEADIDQLQRTLYAVETMSPPLMVDHLNARGFDSPRPNAPPLAIELQVFGLAPPKEQRPNS